MSTRIAVDRAEAARRVGELEAHRVVGAHLGGAADHVADAVGELARRLDAALSLLVDLALQLRDQPGLRRVQRDRGQPEPEVLHEDERHVGDEQAQLERRRGDRLADEAADRVGLGGDHRDDLARRGLLEVRQREPQHRLVELVAEPAHHALADHAAVDVEPVLDAAVEGDQREQRERQQHQVLDLRELVAEHRDREALLAAERVVDDALRQLEVDVDERQARDRHDQQQHLVAPGVVPDVTEQRPLHAAPAPLVRPSPRAVGDRVGRDSPSSRAVSGECYHRHRP